MSSWSCCWFWMIAKRIFNAHGRAVDCEICSHLLLLRLVKSTTAFMVNYQPLCKDINERLGEFHAGRVDCLSSDGRFWWISTLSDDGRSGDWIGKIRQVRIYVRFDQCDDDEEGEHQRTVLLVTNVQWVSYCWFTCPSLSLIRLSTFWQERPARLGYSIREVVFPYGGDDGGRPRHHSWDCLEIKWSTFWVSFQTSKF